MKSSNGLKSVVSDYGERVKRLILTPNHTRVCGMFQLAKDLQGDILTYSQNSDYLKSEKWWKGYDEVITLLYPMHKYGKIAKRNGVKWICYDQEVPPISKVMFPDFIRRQKMRVFSWLNKRSMIGADEYWKLSEIEQKPRWTEKRYELDGMRIAENYAIYLGRKTDYKNYSWLLKTMEELRIHLIHPQNVSDDEVHFYISNARMLVTASLWEGYGRPVMEAEALGVPAVCYDVGTHKNHVKKGIVVPLGKEDLFREAIQNLWKLTEDGIPPKDKSLGILPTVL